MKNKYFLLLGTLLKSTGSRNVIKNSKDKSRRKNAINGFVGKTIIDVILLIFFALTAVSLGGWGLGIILPGLCAMLITIMSFILTLLKSNGYLFGFKEYDMLMSMPFSVKDIVAAKFMYMYLNGLPLVLIINLAMLVGYAVGGELTVLNCVIWLVLSLILPIIPTVIASALGAIVVRLSSGFKKKNVIQTVLTFVVLIPIVFVQFFAQNIAESEEIEEMLVGLSDKLADATKYLPTAQWFEKAVNNSSVLHIVLLVAVSLVIYELFFVVVSKNYRKVNSTLISNSEHTKFAMTAQKQRSMVQAIAFKEFKRMTGSPVYMTNAAMGEIMVFIIGVAALFVKADTIIAAMMHGAPVEASVIFPALPVFVYLFLGMVPTTCCSPSLEGKNYWIIKTMPIDARADISGKILFNLYLTIPFGLFTVFSLSFCFRVGFAEAIAAAVEIVCLCLFSTIRGLKCGLKYRNLEWTNELEVVKQGKAVTIYLLPNIFVTMALLPGVVFLSIALKSSIAAACILTVVALILTAISWQGVKKYVK